MKKKIFFLICIFLVLPLLLAPISLLLAQDKKAGLQLSPISYEVEANPGESFRKEIKLTNISGRKVQVEAATEDFVAGGEQGEPKILVGEEEGASKWSLRHWVRFEENNFDLEKDEKKFVYFDVDIPADAEPGGHYGVVRFTASTLETEGGQVALAGSVGNLVLLKVRGKVSETGKIVDFYTTKTEDSEERKSAWFEKGPVGLVLRFKNTGTVHYKPKGTVEIAPLFGKKAKVSFDERNVLPQSIRKFDTTYKDAPLIGRFTAVATMVYGTKGNISKSQPIVFYIIPWKIVLVVLIVLIILVVFIWRHIRLTRKVRAMEGKKTKKKGKKKKQK